MQLEVGTIVEGKVSGITKFGAFVDLGENKTGMVHISEVAATFVQEIKDYVKEGETVKVKILSIADDGKIALSMKAANPEAAAQQRDSRPPRKDFQNRSGGGQGGQGGGGYRGGQGGGQNRGGGGGYNRSPRTYQARQTDPGPQSFEDMMSKFKQTSDERIGELKRSNDRGRRSGGYGRKGGK